MLTHGERGSVHTSNLSPGLSLRDHDFNLREPVMSQLTSTIAPHREMPDQRFRTVGYVPLCSRRPSRRHGIITKVTGILAIVIAAAFVTDAIAPNKFAWHATMKAKGPQVEHVLVDGVHMAIPTNLAHVPLKDLVPMP